MDLWSDSGDPMGVPGDLKGNPCGLRRFQGGGGLKGDLGGLRGVVSGDSIQKFTGDFRQKNFGFWRLYRCVFGCF